jgi:hypothetical protein
MRLDGRAASEPEQPPNPAAPARAGTRRCPTTQVKSARAWLCERPMRLCLRLVSATDQWGRVGTTWVGRWRTTAGPAVKFG